MNRRRRSETKRGSCVCVPESVKLQTLLNAQSWTCRSAFTLLEVLLALALGALVLVAIATAVSMHLRLVDRGRNSVEEAQLARAVLNMIADDLRATIRYTPPNTEAIKALEASIQPSKTGLTGGESATGGSPAGQGQGAPSGSSSQSGSGGGGPSSSSGGQPNSSSSSGGSSSSTSGGSSGASSAGGSSGGASGTTDTNQEPEGATGEENTQSIPGLYGTLYELQIDIARAPSAQQPLAGVPADGSVLPMATSGVQRIRYYIDTLGTAAAGAPTMTAGSGGLIRRQVDRAIASWAAADGQSEAPGELIQDLAPEVTEVEFYYYDGYEWLEEWNSTPEQPLPLAVEVTVGILPRQLRQAVNANPATSAEATETGILYYKLIVHLPSAEIGAPTSSDSMEEEDSQQNGSGSGGGSNQNPSGGSQGGVRA